MTPQSPFGMLGKVDILPVPTNTPVILKKCFWNGFTVSILVVSDPQLFSPEMASLIQIHSFFEKQLHRIYSYWVGSAIIISSLWEKSWLLSEYIYCTGYHTEELLVIDAMETKFLILILILIWILMIVQRDPDK